MSSDEIISIALDSESIWLRPKTACRALDCGMTQLNRFINEGRLEVRRFGRRFTIISRRSIENIGADASS